MRRGLRNDPEPFSAPWTEHLKVTPVQGENGFNPFAVRKVYQARIGKLDPQIRIPGKDRGNTREIRLVEGSQLKGSRSERGQQHFKRSRVCPQ